VVVPVAWHPGNRNGVIVHDLRVDPTPLLELSADAIRERLYTPSDQLPEGEARIPLKMVSINHAPVIVPLNTLTGEAREKWQLDEAREQRHLQLIRENSELLQKKIADDRRLCEQVRNTPPQELGLLQPPFEAPKLHELLFRYRARNWPETLNREERARWDEYRRHRLTHPDGGSSITLDAYRKELASLSVDMSLTPEQRQVVDALLDWPVEIGL